MSLSDRLSQLRVAGAPPLERPGAPPARPATPTRSAR